MQAKTRLVVAGAALAALTAAGAHPIRCLGPARPGNKSQISASVYPAIPRTPRRARDDVSWSGRTPNWPNCPLFGFPLPERCCTVMR
jgi:hypothetical protein